MLNDKQLESMLYDLSSFYRDFLPVDNNLEKLFKVYAHTIDYAWEQFKEAGDAKHISTTRTLSTIPYFKVGIDDALYDLNTARIIDRMNFEEQIAYLDKERKFASFIFQERDAAGDPTVYSMRLFVNFEGQEPLKLYEDYFLRSNRLYLLPKYIQKRKQAVHHLHAFDIKLNDHTLEKNFGSRFNLEVGPLLPRYEYRDVLEAFIRSFKGQMTIKAVKESIQLATKWDEFRVEDYKSPHISPRKKELYDQWIISPFKFLVTLPEELIPDKIKVNIIRTLLNEIREQQYDFMFFFDIHRFDPYAVPMKRIPTVRYNRGEKLSGDDDHGHDISIKVVDNPFQLFGRYDTTFFYNWNLQYDDPPSNEIVGIHAKSKYVNDQGEVDERVTIRQSPVMIPRSFTSVMDPGTGAITFSVDSNNNVDGFELYGAPSIEGPYELVESVANNDMSSETNFLHDASQSTNLFYKARTSAAGEYSFYTLPIELA